MTYENIKKVIQNAKYQLENELISNENYDSWASNMRKKLDVFVLVNSITNEQFLELENMLNLDKE